VDFCGQSTKGPINRNERIALDRLGHELIKGIPLAGEM
jgi:hypothetical protein